MHLHFMVAGGTRHGVNYDCKIGPRTTYKYLFFGVEFPRRPTTCKIGAGGRGRHRGDPWSGRLRRQGDRWTGPRLWGMEPWPPSPSDARPSSCPQWLSMCVWLSVCVCVSRMDTKNRVIQETPRIKLDHTRPRSIMHVPPLLPTTCPSPTRIFLAAAHLLFACLWQPAESRLEGEWIGNEDEKHLI
jgi:hypothetical protein